MFSPVFDFDPNVVPTQDGTFRNQEKDLKFWEGIKKEYDRGTLNIIIAEGECYRRKSSNFQKCGFNDTMFNLETVHGRKFQAKLYHLGSVPVQYQNKLLNNCKFNF